MALTHAALVLHETGAEINENNLTAVLDAANADVPESRVKALIAALEGVDIADLSPAADDRATGGADGAVPADADEPDAGTPAVPDDADRDAADAGQRGRTEAVESGEVSDADAGR